MSNDPQLRLRVADLERQAATLDRQLREMQRVLAQRHRSDARIGRNAIHNQLLTLTNSRTVAGGGAGIWGGTISLPSQWDDRHESGVRVGTNTTELEFAHNYQTWLGIWSADWTINPSPITGVWTVTAALSITRGSHFTSSDHLVVMDGSAAPGVPAAVRSRSLAAFSFGTYWTTNPWLPAKLTITYGITGGASALLQQASAKVWLLRVR